jgi:hypothetical protein
MSVGVGHEFISLADIENLEIAFRISRFFITERQIQVLPVWRPPYCVSGVGRCRNVIRFSGLRLGEVCQSLWKANLALVLVSAFIIQEN